MIGEFANWRAESDRGIARQGQRTALQLWVQSQLHEDSRQLASACRTTMRAHGSAPLDSIFMWSRPKHFARKDSFKSLAKVTNRHCRGTWLPGAAIDAAPRNLPYECCKIFAEAPSHSANRFGAWPVKAKVTATTGRHHVRGIRCVQLSAFAGKFALSGLICGAMMDSLVKRRDDLESTEDIACKAFGSGAYERTK